ncbi:flippase [Acetobacterium malicum]|nr:flippase [Acetobacterium malicum]
MMMVDKENNKNRNPLLKINFIMNSILTMSQFIFPLITFPYVSRILLPEGTGKVAFATSIIAYFAMFAQLGIPTYGIRACAKVRDNKEELTKTTQELFIINITMCVIMYALFVIALYFVPRLMEEKMLFIIVSFVIIFNAIGMEWLYKGLEQYTYITVRSIIIKFIALIAIFFLIQEEDDYLIYAGITVFAASASGVLNFINAHKYISMKPVGGYNFRRHIKAIVIFFATSCAIIVYTNLDIVMLGFIQTDKDVGYYNAAVKIKIILLSIVTSLGTVLLPRASYYIEHNMKDEFFLITHKAINFVILIASPLTLFFIFFAREGVLFLSGNAYEGSILPMQIIMPTLLVIGLTNIMGIQMLVPMGKEKIVLYSVIAGAVVNLIANSILIPKMGASGAAIGTLIAEIVVWIVQFAFLKEMVKNIYLEVNYISIIIALLLGTAGSIWCKSMGMSYFMTLLVSSVLFFGIYTLVLTIAKEPLVIEIEGQVFGKIIKKFKESEKSRNEI